MGSQRLVVVHSCGEKQKREEKMHKWLRKTILVMHDHGEKIQEVGVNSHGGLEGTMMRKREETRGERSRMNMYKQEKGKKKRTALREKKENEQAEITQPTDFQGGKKQQLNRATTQRKNVTTS